jgi:hypothetical protein
MFVAPHLHDGELQGILLGVISAVGALPFASCPLSE